MIKIAEILEKTPHRYFLGNIDCVVEAILPLDVANNASGVLMWANDKNIDKIKQLSAGTIICSENAKDSIQSNVNAIIVDNPRDTFRKILDTFFNPKPKYEVSKSSYIHPSVICKKNISIGENVVIEEGCKLGDNVIIDHNTVVKRNTIIGNNVKIGANCTIGGAGFGYEKDIDGEYILIPHLGNVVLEDNVEIGNNTCIDRAVLGNTFLSKNVKVDNLVHIAHGVLIGENSLIIANAMVAGSTVIGKNVWVAPSTSIINKVTIGNNALVGLGAVVVKNVEDSTIVIGNPAKALERK